MTPTLIPEGCETLGTMTSQAITADVHLPLKMDIEAPGDSLWITPMLTIFLPALPCNISPPLSP